MEIGCYGNLGLPARLIATWCVEEDEEVRPLKLQSVSHVSLREAGEKTRVLAAGWLASACLGVHHTSARQETASG